MPVPWLELEDHAAAVEAFCRKNHIKKLLLFGSYLHGKEGKDSDVDLIAIFDEAHIPGWEFFSMEDDLCGIFNKKIDLQTPGFIGKRFREQVLSEARALYG